MYVFGSFSMTLIDHNKMIYVIDKYTGIYLLLLTQYIQYINFFMILRNKKIPI